MHNNPIGIIDSGVGGLSVWKEVVSLLPNESIIYLADSKHVPYGSRTPEEICMLATRLTNFLVQKQVKMIIVACNTITVTCLDMLRQKHPEIPIIGTVPVIKTAAEKTQNGIIGVFSTTRTAESTYQQELIQKFAQDKQVISVETDNLVPLIEQGIHQGEEIRAVLVSALQPIIEKGADVLAMACTHYPFIEEEVQKVMGSDVLLLEPSGAIARHAKRILEQNKANVDAGSPQYDFYSTGDASLFSTVAKKLLQRTIQAEQVDLG